MKLYITFISVLALTNAIHLKKHESSIASKNIPFNHNHPKDWTICDKITHDNINKKEQKDLLRDLANGESVITPKAEDGRAEAGADGAKAEGDKAAAGGGAGGAGGEKAGAGGGGGSAAGTKPPVVPPSAAEKPGAVANEHWPAK